MKTAALNFLEQHHVAYQLYEYEHDNIASNFGKHASIALGLNEEIVCKTIIVHQEKQYVSCIVSVKNRVSLKKVARLAQLKQVSTTDPTTAQKITGYVVGGISPFAQKHKHLTLVDASLLDYPEILVSAGKRGLSIGLKPQDLIMLLQAKIGDICE